MTFEASARDRPASVVSDKSTNDKPLYFACKRCIDVVVAALMLGALLPLMLIIALLIKLETPGPVLFLQKRVGSRRRSRDGQTTWEIQDFDFFKFRSMVDHADPSVHEARIRTYIEGSSEEVKPGDDHRSTGVGQILRRTSLDELPQLVNVLKGEMSLVGPRPVPTYEVAEYKPPHYERLAALPGITGLWQVNGRCERSFEEQIQLDLEYVRDQSLWLDIRILARTIPAVLSGRGAV